MADTMFNTLLKKIDLIFENLPKKPEIPAVLLAYAVPEQKGVSSARIVSKIENRLAQAGIKTDLMPSGEKNLMNQMIQIVVEEIIHELLYNGRIEMGTQIGAMTFTGEGGNAGGPVSVVGRNLNISKGYGLIR